MGFFKYSMNFLNSITFATTGYEAFDEPLKGVVKSYLFQQQSYLNEAPTDEELNSLKADISSQWDNMILFVKPKYVEALRLSGVTQITNTDTTVNQYGDETTTGSYYEPKVSGTQAQINTNGQKVQKAQDVTILTQKENLVLDSASMTKLLEDLREEIESYFIEFVNFFFDLDEECPQLGQLSQEQRDAVNSGINSTLVGKITANENNISNLQSGKQDKLSTTQMNAVNSGIDSNKVSQIATNTQNISAFNANVVANANNIAVNVANISNNLNLIRANSAKIETNEDNIATNTENIATNAQNISANAIAIENNVQNIAYNTTRVTQNANNIATNTANIAENSENIEATATAVNKINEKVPYLQTENAIINPNWLVNTSGLTSFSATGEEIAFVDGWKMGSETGTVSHTYGSQRIYLCPTGYVKQDIFVDQSPQLMRNALAGKKMYFTVCLTGVIPEGVKFYVEYSTRTQQNRKKELDVSGTSGSTAHTIYYSVPSAIQSLGIKIINTGSTDTNFYVLWAKAEISNGFTSYFSPKFTILEQLKGRELVNTISSSSTDNEVPTAKAIYDFVMSLTQ